MPPAFALSQDQTLRFISSRNRSSETKRTRSCLSSRNYRPPKGPTENLTSVSVTHKKYTSTDTPLIGLLPRRSNKIQSNRRPEKPNPIRFAPNDKDAANVSLPSLFNCQRAEATTNPSPAPCGQTGFCCLSHYPIRQAGEEASRTAGEKQEASSPAVSGGLGHHPKQVNNLFHLFSLIRHIHTLDIKKTATKAGFLRRNISKGFRT